VEVGCVTRAEHYPASPGEALRTVTPHLDHSVALEHSTKAPPSQQGSPSSQDHCFPAASPHRFFKRHRRIIILVYQKI
jgi:hypothetical protein